LVSKKVDELYLELGFRDLDRFISDLERMDKLLEDIQTKADTINLPSITVTGGGGGGGGGISQNQFEQIMSVLEEIRFWKTGQTGERYDREKVIQDALQNITKRYLSAMKVLREDQREALDRVYGEIVYLAPLVEDAKKFYNLSKKINIFKEKSDLSKLRRVLESLQHLTKREDVIKYMRGVARDFSGFISEEYQKEMEKLATLPMQEAFTLSEYVEKIGKKGKTIQYRIDAADVDVENAIIHLKEITTEIERIEGDMAKVSQLPRILAKQLMDNTLKKDLINSLNNLIYNYTIRGNLSAAQAVEKRMKEITEKEFKKYNEALKYVKEVFRFGHEIYLTQAMLSKIEELKKGKGTRVLAPQLQQYFKMLESGEIRREFWREQMGAYVGETIDKIAEKLGETSEDIKKVLQSVRDDIVNRVDDFSYESMVKD